MQNNFFSDKDIPIKELLERYVEKNNTPDFIPNDPVQFPRRFTDKRDIEIVSFLSAILAWGKRSLILRDVERLLNEMDNQPYNYLKEQAFLDFDADRNVHRTIFGRHFQYLMNGFYSLYKKYDSLDDFSFKQKFGDSPLPSFSFAEALLKIMIDSNGGKKCPEVIPSNLQSTALKRINMAIRWLVRDDGIVDMGIWKSIPKSKLIIPLDVHVGNTSRSLGLLTRKANDKKSALQLTEKLKEFCPEDPIKYDFALFGIGVYAPKKK